MTVDPAILKTYEREGWAVLHDVLAPAEVDEARRELAAAADRSDAAGMARMEILDKGDCNRRVYNLPEQSPVFLHLVAHEAVMPYIERILDDDVVISNFTANIALPGSGSMNAHCDQSTVIPEPWTECWALNAIWCLDDCDEENGATRYLPGSHHFHRFADVPADPKQGMRPFEAKAGSVILMDGRVWHTSGENRSENRERALCFAFYTRSFLRPQNNWWRSLSRETQRGLSPQMQTWLGLDFGNMKYGAYLTGEPSKP